MGDQEVVTAQIVDGSRQLAVEIKAQRELAVSNPRNEAKVLAACLSELAIAPEFAEDAFYSIPYNKGKENETLVEGLSVKASRAVARRWGNCAVASRIANETEDSIETEGVFADFETNVFLRRIVQVSKTYVESSTKIKRPLSGVHLTNAIQAGLSKAERNAVLSGLPEYFKERVFASAKKIAGSKDKATKTIEERFMVLFAQFEKLGADKKTVESYIKSRWTAGTDPDEVLGAMRGIFNAIKAKETTVADVFGIIKMSGPSGPVGAGDLTGGRL